MRPSKFENSIVYAWLIFIQNNYGIYEVDNRHNCHAFKESTINYNTIIENEILEAKRRRQCRVKQCIEEVIIEEENTIIRPFVWLPDFYGCIRCGRYHFCRRREVECEFILNAVDDQMTCIHSGKLLNEASSYVIGNFHGEKQFDTESSKSPMTLRIDTSKNKSLNPYHAEHKLYTNINIKMPFSSNTEPLAYNVPFCDKTKGKKKKKKKKGRKKKIQGKTSTEINGLVNDFTNEDLYLRKSSSSKKENGNNIVICPTVRIGDDLFTHKHNPVGENDMIIEEEYDISDIEGAESGEEEEEEVGNGEEVINSTTIRYKNIHPNKIFWTEYYQFLLPFIIVITTRDSDQETEKRQDLMYVENKTKLITHVMEEISSETSRLIDATLYLVVSKAITLQCQHSKIQLTNDKIQLSLVQFYTPIIYRIVQLMQHICKKHTKIANNLSIHNICIAFLFDHLTQSYCLEDSHGSLIQIWRKDPWLGLLRETGIIECIYHKKNRKGAAKPKSVHAYDKKQVQETSLIIKRVLSLCQNQALWLRDFLLNNRND